MEIAFRVERPQNPPARRLRNSRGGKLLPSTRDAISAAAAELRGEAYQHIIVFFSSEHDLDVLIAELNRRFP